MAAINTITHKINDVTFDEEKFTKNLSSYNREFINNLYKNMGYEVSNITPPISNLSINHFGYMHYIFIAYVNHLSIEVTPAHIWTIVLSEISSIVNSNPEDYKGFFTKNKVGGAEKIKIEDTGNIMHNVELFVSEVKKRSPLDISLLTPAFDKVQAGFSTTCNISIGEIVKKFYMMNVMGCGFPQIELDSNIKNWELAADHVAKLAVEFSGKNTECGEYLLKTAAAFKTCGENLESAEYWKNFFSIENCSSGSPVYEFNKCILREFLVSNKSDFLKDYIKLARMPYFVDAPLNKGKWWIVASGLAESTVDAAGS